MDKSLRICRFTNEQLNYIHRHILEEEVKEQDFFVDPNKVLAVKRYLDNFFVRAAKTIVGSNGYPDLIPIIGMKDSSGTVIRNMSPKQLFFLLQDKFSKIYHLKEQRDKFLMQIIKDWYNRKITKEGLLSVNRY